MTRGTKGLTRTQRRMIVGSTIAGVYTTILLVLAVYLAKVIVRQEWCSRYIGGGFDHCLTHVSNLNAVALVLSAFIALGVVGLAVYMAADFLVEQWGYPTTKEEAVTYLCTIVKLRYCFSALAIGGGGMWLLFTFYV